MGLRDAFPMHDPNTNPESPDATAPSVARLRVLAEVSRTFARVANDYEALIAQIARVCADVIGDGCTLTLVEGSERESLVNAASCHRDPALEADYRAWLGGMRVPLSGSSMSARVVRTGEPVLVPSIEPASVVAMSDEPLKPIVERLNVHAFVLVPIFAGGEVIGTLGLQRSGPGRPYGPDDVTLLQDLADRAGLAIANARWVGELEHRVSARTAELAALNEELNAFAHSASHDLRAPLRAVRGFGQLLSDRYGAELGEEGQGYIDRMMGAAKSMTSILDALMALSRVSRTEVTRGTIDFTALVRRVVDECESAEPSRSGQIDIEPSMSANGDPDLLRLLVQNLITNALKFTAKVADPHIWVGCSTLEDGTRVYAVSDNGVGFDMAYVSKLFQPFQRLHTRSEYEGSGIGLATCARVVRRHGGRIWAEAAVGKGATFSFTLGG